MFWWGKGNLLVSWVIRMWTQQCSQSNICHQSNQIPNGMNETVSSSWSIFGLFLVTSGRVLGSPVMSCFLLWHHTWISNRHSLWDGNLMGLHQHHFWGFQTLWHSAKPSLLNKIQPFVKGHNSRAIIKYNINRA